MGWLSDVQPSAHPVRPERLASWIERVPESGQTVSTSNRSIMLRSSHSKGRTVHHFWRYARMISPPPPGHGTGHPRCKTHGSRVNLELDIHTHTKWVACPISDTWTWASRRVASFRQVVFIALVGMSRFGGFLSFLAL